MVNKCLEENCKLYASFNLPNEKIGIYCKKHSMIDMIDVISPRCKEKNCNKRSVFNIPNKKTGLYCSKHKKVDMIDVKHKKCNDENCNKRPSFNFENKKIGIYCNEHKKENMINIISLRCKKENCNTIPSYNYKNKKIGIYCNEHKKVDMIDVQNRRCLEENCDTYISNKKYKGYCLRCFINLFPNEKVSRNYKIKENHMTDFLKDIFKDEIMVFDKQTSGCSKRRPDCYIDKFTHVIIIECDENQHKENSCENKRSMELFQDFCNRPIVFVRFNPDSYIKDNKKMSSSFTMHKTLDVPIIREAKEWKYRLEILKETIDKFLDKIPTKEVTIEYLFYDE